MQKSFQNDKNGAYFIVIALCPVLQDFVLCKLEGLERHKVDTKCCKIKKDWRLFLYKTETLCSYTHCKVPWYVHCDISMATQRAPRPLCPKGKIRVLHRYSILFYIILSILWCHKSSNFPKLKCLKTQSRRMLLQWNKHHSFLILLKALPNKLIKNCFIIIHFKYIFIVSLMFIKKSRSIEISACNCRKLCFYFAFWLQGKSIPFYFMRLESFLI